MSIIQGSAHTSAGGGGYQIQRSLRFNSADSAYLNRTFSSGTNTGTWTWSGWVKRSVIGTQQYLFYAASSAPNAAGIDFLSDQLRWFQANGTTSVRTTQLFRDVSAWYHIVVVMDTGNATSTDRLRMYVNGSRITSFASASYPSSGGSINNSVAHAFGRDNTYGSEYFNGYMTEVNFIDGQALTPSSFGETDSNTGVWKPKAYTGTYGTNGFYLKFADNSGTTSTTLGKDSSGNGNNWTPNNFSVTAGAGNDSLVDTPTSYGTDTGVGGEVRGNYCTWNPLAGTGSGVTGYGWTSTNGNLDFTATNAATYSNTITSTFSVTNEKWYVEITMGNSPGGGHPIIGVIRTESISTATSTSNFQNATYISVIRATDGQKSVFESTSFVSYGSSFSSGDVLNLAVDSTNGKIWWGKNGTWFNSGAPASGTNAGDTFTVGQALSLICIAYNANGTHVLNAGQRPFAYTAPSGFKALCTQNLPTPTIGATSTTQANDYFNAVLYTGTGSSQGITGVGFQPDFVWIKGRSGATDHGLYDAVRGVQNQLESNTTTAETTETTGLTAFGSDGFTVGALAQLNTSSATYVGWNWNAGGSTVTNTSGTISAQVRANTTAGFSIVTSGVSTSAFTVGHGLGVAPAMMISKTRNVADAWYVYHQSLAATESLRLNTSGAVTTGGFNGTRPTSTVLTLGGFGSNSYTNVVYCFAEVAGYSAFGSYSGNNSATDGTFVYLGFRPRFLMIKSTSAGTDWVMVDTARSTYNLSDTSLYADSSNSEATIGTVNDIDILSNGFKLRNNTGFVNASQTYIYAAFAESPFKYSLAR